MTGSYRQSYTISDGDHETEVTLPGKTPEGYVLTVGDRVLVQLYQSPVPYEATVKRIKRDGQEVSEATTGEDVVVYCQVALHANTERGLHPDAGDVIYPRTWLRQQLE